ncbi:uncharacterized protein LOC104901534 [Beta vulgaris subsp. vulgaris]|uniref:uncharacterized protein LOC104901534 n=1 Tax=Beta vulgaris subsp. vulgaris TaxID=3555 RepID=UPI002548B8E1|nr:uncharacterized protein LOC104901534 [Beta vulgaris subsp. vulgaris]
MQAYALSDVAHRCSTVLEAAESLSPNMGNAEIHLDAKDLGDTIKEENKATSQNKAKAMIFLRHHLHEGLKIEYLTVKDPQVLWSNLKERHNTVKRILRNILNLYLVSSVEQNNELLMKNHESRPTGSAPFPEANATSHNGKEKYHANNSGRGRGRGYGHGRGRGRGYRYG